MKNKIKIIFVLVVAFTLSASTTYATWINIQITTATYAYDISWDLTDSNGTVLAYGPSIGGYSNYTTYNHYIHLAEGCYNMNMYDSYGAGWNGGVYNILDSATGTISYATGGLAFGSFGTDLVCIGAFGCTNPLAINYDSSALVNNDSCIFSTCTNVTLYMQDSYGNGWNGSLWTITGVNGGSFGSFTLTSGSVSQVSFCLPDDCYDITVTLNQYPGDISWQLIEDSTGNILAEGCNSINPCAFIGCPYNGPTLCLPVIWGCTNPFASNFDSLATLNDGSCLYPGCMDSIALNYCSACNVNDSLSCIYPSCHTLDFCEDFESANLITNDWVINNGIYSSVGLTITNAIVDTISLEFTGGSVVYGTQLTETAAFSDPDHISTATICVDMSGSGMVDLAFEGELSSNILPNCAWFRVRVNGTVVADKNGVTAFNDQTMTGMNTYAYDLSSYSGQSQVYVTFEAMCSYNTGYSSGFFADYVWIDNVCVFDVGPCTYYSASATVTDVACNGDSTGAASVIVSNGTGTDSFVWSNGMTTGSVSGLAAGTYMCIVNDSTNGCSDSIIVTITEPSVVSISGVMIDESFPTAGDGSINVTVSGGTPCATDIYLGTSTNISGSGNHLSAALFYTQYIENKSELTFQATELSALGLQVGQSLSSVGWNIATASGQVMNSLNIDITESGVTTNVYFGNYTAVVGWNDFTFSTPVIWNGGDIVVTTCFDNSSWTTPNTWYYTTTSFVSCSYLYQGTTAGSICTNSTTATTSNRPNTRFGTNGIAYTFAWSNGDTTEDIDSLTMGPYVLSVIDCNGCIETNSWFLMVNTVPGCTDSSAFNYNPLANEDDSSCLYLGCTDSLALNFDSTANLNDSSCVYPCNYYGLNNVVVVINSGDWAHEMSWDVTDANGTILGSGSGYTAINTDSVGVHTLCLTDGCYNFNMYDSYGDGWNGGNYVIYVNGISIATGGLLSGSFGTDQFQVGTSLPCPIFGCTDSLASNYNILATVDDSSCVYCTGNTLILEMYDSWGDGWNGAFFVLQEISNSSAAISTTLPTGAYGIETYTCVPDGCYNLTVNSGFYPYEVSWILTNGSGTVLVSGGAPFIGGLNLNTSCIIGCMDSLALNYDSTAVLPDSCIYPVYGCMDSTAYNYNPSAIIDDGSCMVNLFFSEAAEGSSNNKYFEIYNPTNNPVNLDDYAFARVSNAPTTVGVYEYWVDFDTAAVVLANDVYIVAHSSADSVILAQADMTYSALSNGDDGFALVYGGKPSSPVLPGNEYIILDFLGDFNGDPGSGWNVAGVSEATKDHTLVRKCSINIGNTNWTTSAGTDSLNSEWEVFPSNYWSDIGQHTMPCPGITGCTDSTACNYNPAAVQDDGSCLGLLGCIDSTQFNYNPLATCDDGSCQPIIYGCTDSTAINYYPGANTIDPNFPCLYIGCNDPTATNYSVNNVGCDSSGSTICCTYSGVCGPVTGVNMTDVIHDRATFNWDNMNSSTCNVDQIRIRYREVGTSSYSNKTMGTPVGSGCNTANTYKRVLGLSASTQYEYDFKLWYCGAATVNWHSGGTFTTAPVCDNVTNVTATPNSATQTVFCWTNPASHAFVRLQYRENVPGSSFSNIGGFGVMSPATCKTKNGLTPGTQYRVMYRTWCSATGGPYRSPVWDGPVIWDQPSVIRLEGGNTAITNLEVYPNPSRDIFNVSFVSDEVQNLEISIINVVGEAVYTADLDQFIGQFTKEVSLATYPKGVYFLEITTGKGVINKKLILQ